MQNHILQRSIHNLRFRKLLHDISKHSRRIQSIAVPRTGSSSSSTSLSTRGLRGPSYHMFRNAEFIAINFLFFLSGVHYIFDIRNGKRGFSYIGRNDEHSRIFSFYENFLLFFHRKLRIQRQNLKILKFDLNFLFLVRIF